MSLYLGSLFVMLLFIAFFYFQNEKRLYFDLTKSNMQNVASKISSKIVYAHMSNARLDISNILESNDYKVSFYNKKKEKLSRKESSNIDFSKDIIKKDNRIILVDSSTLGHLGIYYIVIEENKFYSRIEKLKIDTALFFLLIYSFIALVGFYLARLFLKPIKQEREKLNNFIKDTTHELNTPITAILMSTEKSNLSYKQIERIRLSAKRVSEIYKDLTYIFLQTKENQEFLEYVDLKDIIDEQLKYFEALSAKKRIKIINETESFKYKIDQDDFIRVINNLISNAIKYNKHNGEIKIVLKNGILKISDTGIGIDTKHKKDIFKRYYRATNQQGGFGIGLSIVSYICEKYNIKLDVQSKLKKGTTFILEF
ncbi:MAG: sensor histidine kinase [Campylobacterota bacterium]